MKRREQNARQMVDRFLVELGAPVSDERSERATENALERLSTDDVQFFTMPPVPVSRFALTRAWGAVAAAVMVLVAGGLLQMTLLRPSGVDPVAKSVRGELRSTGVASLLNSSARIEAGRVVRAGAGGGALTLLDGSQIDMSPNAELSIIREADGLRVQLSSGTVLVTAAKQHDGHLYVETKDCLISVVGTVFAVSAEESGSRVSVLEGEVRVQRGDISETLVAGQQASTSPKLRPLPDNPGDGWIDSQRLALLQQPVAQALQAPSPNIGVVVNGFVKQASTGMGIPDVTVTLCQDSPGTQVEGRLTTRERQPGPNDAGQPALPEPIIRNKTFFLAVWDRVVCQARSGIRTDSMGRFQFSNVSPGEYVLTAEREGYAGLSMVGSNATATARKAYFRFQDGWATHGASDVGTILAGERQNLTVEAQKTPQEVALTMVRAGVISGHVRDADGKLLVNAQVGIIAFPDQGAAGSGSIVLTSKTNDLGEYRAYWLLPGEYRVIASGPPGRPSSETWFPRGASAAEASAVVVREGEEVSVIDIILRPTLPSDAPVVPGVPGWRVR